MKIVVSQNDYYLEKDKSFYGPYHSVSDAEHDALRKKISKLRANISEHKIVRPHV